MIVDFKKLLYLFLLTTFLWIGSVNAASANYAINFYDGDNLILIQGGIKTKVSLACVDAPELKQLGGQTARKALKSLVDGKQISMRVITKDRFGRLLAEVFAGNKNVNQSLIEGGYVYFNGQYRKECDRYQDWEQIAKQKQLGVWHNHQKLESPAKFRQDEYGL